MKIIFMGTPDFSIPSLKILLKNNHEILAVVTTPDKERGRGQKITFTAVKQFAIDNNIPVLQPIKLKDESFINELKNLNPDLFIIVAFRILPKEVFEIPKYGSFNLHGSYLPKYRGAAPIQWALINGDKETGLTTFKLAEKVDTGNIYLQEKVEINTADNFETLHDRMSLLGAELVLKTVSLIEHGDYELLQQDDSLASPAPKITKEICSIDFNKSAKEIHNLVRGLSPHPAAFFIYNNKVIKIYKTEIVESINLKPFEFHQTKTELIIGCGKDALRILELQQEGKRRMDVEEFLRGFRSL
ncbi:MAG: methionyl-tRNA formyltransferase [Ignavibacteriaceae bacterium]|nr:methionyl-tRNA formyltransferase [Ignavibacterium sp.]MCC6255018.1 methionyl-tRNA formyltransferase [Ignavibacteriaceae bacterium]HRN25617.1 methionyl-tRNA formyltransferase [Ignavibacteriaceae bacterium]HRP92468.1 methionyl-tRNA formyltransferase [Ignavibacteriaceae bacterium]